MRFRRRLEAEGTGERDVERRLERRTVIDLAAPFFCLHEGVPKLPNDKATEL